MDRSALGLIGTIRFRSGQRAARLAAQIAVHCVKDRVQDARKNRAPVGLRWSGRTDVLGHRT